MLRRQRFYKKRKCRVDKRRVFCYNLPCVCGRSSSGRARPCQGRGSEFEPRRPLQKETPSVRMVFSFWNAAGRLELAASTGALAQSTKTPPERAAFLFTAAAAYPCRYRPGENSWFTARGACRSTPDRRCSAGRQRHRAPSRGPWSWGWRCCRRQRGNSSSRRWRGE